ncbi:GTP-binding protein Di-Ras2 [Wyeomyia smithii]|uniref:GTP-binding protein Di-Ras2 n=1 Tax=Wyeomyia smithii TaxID=174621 RepID=UPI002467E2CC|nr:GTP-binding protein Di-Ras2 [Wyeomyia smithii]XP_055528523.1 GTP-binding protein Di-Ras2 [Wyeomyia smithii]XP_055528524.1 GTP-binding protein Di-Ras2 [Wyeomyia smithii]XP_055528525.1 GTP-binding protein Di-Ras2 [Wyeomyia smithii]XP_055528526.1 GTP-binding protein Di-Ras2 [Wyeomyia smithii]XP_055528527.1 GTP-binding protein Di-Ras2 [Wyeomyia smithii]
MKGRHLRRRFSLQPSFMKDDSPEDKPKREKPLKNDENSINSNVRHRIVVMGAAKVGKSSLITQFLYNAFSPKYKRTVEEMHHGHFSVGGVNLTLDILDTSGSYEFPAMRALSISSADAFILVYDVTDSVSFEEVKAIREQIHEIKATTAVPIVVVGNKTDLTDEDDDVRQIPQDTTESMITVDWENGFVEASAKLNRNVSQIFKELLAQAKIAYNLSPALRRRRRQSLPQQASVGGVGGGTGPPTPQQSMPPSSVHVPSAAQLAHLQQIQDKSLGGKRNSCILS